MNQGSGSVTDSDRWYAKTSPVEGIGIGDKATGTVATEKLQLSANPATWLAFLSPDF
jgi:hypothetical protein